MVINRFVLYEDLEGSCRMVLTIIKGICRPMIQPIVLELIDKRPRVGCHNRDIKMRQAVIAQLHKSTKKNKAASCHRGQWTSGE